ncbi:hypothetical protein [Hymenobacter sp. BT559]|uniref:hypothetical protein n=1 Tax=Hymenobacter sp. BT559 TaxID=2795729 RepID=UPI0018ED0306|nr:hypothetical protein [Hymenobacter sp. BT559]MBJ6144352.1 hypothetical protein [Hymenobacter sp. BT559]
MANYATLGHYLPYLLGRRLRAVVWPPDGGERALALFLLGIMALYGVGFGFMLNHQTQRGIAGVFPKMLVALNAAWLVSTLLVDFLPTLRPITRPLPEHFPVSERQNVVTAFLLDLITLRRLMLVLGLLLALLVAPRHALVPGFSLLLILGATVLSFNVRLLVTLGRWRHPLLAANLLSLGLMGWWLAVPAAPYAAALGVSMALLPWLVGAAQLYWLAPYFSARYLPAATATTAPNTTLARLPLEWKVYLRKVWLPLTVGLVFKAILLSVTGLAMIKNGKVTNPGLFYLGLLPIVSFTYVNNNLFAYLGSLTANELIRLGLTRRLLALYLRLVLPVLLADCLLAVVFVLALFPTSLWHMLGLLPLAGAALLSVGLWASLHHAKPVIKAIDFANMRNNTSGAMSATSIGIGAALYFTPWWWVRIALALLVAASAAWPLRQVLRNDGALRRKLLKGIGA